MKNKYVAPGKVAINGGSNGGQNDFGCVATVHQLSIFLGLLVGACLNRAPEGTFGAAVAQVGVLDLLKVQTCSCRTKPPS